MNECYWKDLISTALRVLQIKNNVDAVFVMQNGNLKIENSCFDNWNGGTDYWDIIFTLKLSDFMALEERKVTIEKEILGVLEQLHSDTSNQISNVIIKPEIKRIINWNAILPETKENIIGLIQEEQKLLSNIATGRVSFVGNDELATIYHSRHNKILNAAQKAGFDYPIHYDTLDEWWAVVRVMPTYAERRKFISKLFFPVIKMLFDSDETENLNFNSIATRSEIIRKVIDDVQIFIREGKYESAVDRVHTCLHSYLRHLLDKHKIKYIESDSLPALYTKLHTFYEEYIQPADVRNRIKTILRSASGMINSINELRNNNTLTHPNCQLIQKREAQLVIRLVNAIVDYIEDIEETLQK